MLIRSLTFLLLSLIQLLCCLPASAQLRVSQISEDNAAQLIKGGIKAIGGVGDWLLSNGVICAVVSDVANESQFSLSGGVLVDLGYCDRNDDLYTSSQDLLDGKRETPVNIDEITTQIDAQSATLITRGRQGATQVEIRYSLNLDQPSQLHINRHISLAPERLGNFNIYTSLWFNYHSLEPFILSTKSAEHSVGFNHVDFATRGVSSLTDAAHNADVLVLVSPPDITPAIAYGWQIKSARRSSAERSYDLPRFLMADEESVVSMVMADTFYIDESDKLEWWHIPQIPLLSLSQRQSIDIEEVIHVAKSADVAAITNQLMPAQTTVKGVADEADSALHIFTPSGRPLTFVRPNQQGEFQFKLPAGRYLLRHVGSAKRHNERLIEVADSELDLGRLSLPEAAILLLPRKAPMRLVFKGLDGTPDPDFDDSLTDFTVSDGSELYQPENISQLFLAGLESDPAAVSIAPGKYRVYATRGPEFSLETTEIEVRSEQALQLPIAKPVRQLLTPHYIAADLHVHSGYSFDNVFAPRQRVRTFVAEGGEVLVSSEHDVPVDFSTVIESMQLEQQLTAIAAVEMTGLLKSKKLPFTNGHVNFFPYEPQLTAHRKGMFNHESLRLREAFHQARLHQPNVVSQLNHARQHLALSGEIPRDYRQLIDSQGYLDHMGVAGYPYNPSKPITSKPNDVLIEKDPETGLRDIDFDAMEIINPGGEFHEQRIGALRKDWFSFLKQGFKITGTANSDSHGANQQVAVPRTMVALWDDSIERFNQAEFLNSIKSGNAYGTTGPVLSVSFSGVDMGGLYHGKKGNLKINIASADWIPVDRLRVQVNGGNDFELDASEQKEFVIEMDFIEDSFVTVEVFGPASQDYNAVYPGLLPYAFSNPIYIDYDADGLWQAPGL